MRQQEYTCCNGGRLEGAGCRALGAFRLQNDGRGAGAVELGSGGNPDRIAPASSIATLLLLCFLLLINKSAVIFWREIDAPDAN
jgi:hypothetical protein